jgi:hypothetical protein
MSYCSLDEAFPQLAGDTKDASCWSQNATLNTSEAKVSGAQVSASSKSKAKKETSTPQTIVVVPPFYDQSCQSPHYQSTSYQEHPSYHYQQHNQQCYHNQHHHHKHGGHGECMSHLQHCLHCPNCYQMLQLYFRMQGNPHMFNSLNRQGAQSAQSAKEAKRSRSLLNEPIMEGSSITWGTILVLLTAGTFILVMLELGKRMNNK